MTKFRHASKLDLEAPVMHEHTKAVYIAEKTQSSLISPFEIWDL